MTPQMPDYDALAENILNHILMPARSPKEQRTCLATALKAAYARGKDDSINQEEMDLLLKHRVQRHARSLDRLADRLHSFTLELRNELPKEKP